METTKKKIVIAGAGFGGITAALFLNKAFSRNPKLRREYQIIIVNNHHSHLYTPAIYEIAAIPQGRHALDYVKSSITIPLADIFHRTLVEWRERQIVAIDRIKKELRFDNDETLGYEYLVLALGAETSYFNIPGAKEHSYPLKTFADAVKLQTEGSGLGLFLVRNIIARHGGSVAVDTEEGKGSTFSFTLPLNEDHVPENNGGQEEFIEGLSV
ncbi:MAG: Pyridine nucleotide-disulfide oxidoreductase [Parcubacteria group bacterium GW2011_GWC2_52_8c]|nr:MAG: Pyridine nucleotide-disulfide oxidoreductase [Parcubacteria group bacterium GW2011_GWC2_52_8c]